MRLGACGTIVHAGRQAGQQVATEFPWLEMHAACTDFTRQPAMTGTSLLEGTRMAFFSGSSIIGNFDPDAAVGFMAAVAEGVKPGQPEDAGRTLRVEAGKLEGVARRETGQGGPIPFLGEEQEDATGGHQGQAAQARISAIASKASHTPSHCLGLSVSPNQR
jgi:hypothetical protein